MLSLKTLHPEIKNTLGVSNRGYLIQGIVIKMLEGLENKSEEEVGGWKKKREDALAPELSPLMGVAALWGVG